MAIADTGASGHYSIRPLDPHTTNATTQTTITAGLPNGDTLQSNDTECALDIPQLPQEARQAHLLPGITHSSLVSSIGKLCDVGCEATFNKDKVVVSKDKTTVLTGTRDTRTGLWKFPMRTTKQPRHTPVPAPTLQCANVLQL
jgi:hypothetical protein